MGIIATTVAAKRKKHGNKKFVRPSQKKSVKNGRQQPKEKKVDTHKKPKPVMKSLKSHADYVKEQPQEVQDDVLDFVEESIVEDSFEDKWEEDDYPPIANF